MVIIGKAAGRRLGLGLVAVLVACAPAPPPGPPAPAPAPGVEPAPVTPAPARPATEGFVEAAGAAGRLWYRAVGEGRDTVIIPLGAMLHDAIAPMAGNRTFVFYDPRARGRSDSLPDSTFATFEGDVADIEALRSALGISRAALIGYDYFAAVAVAYAAQHPTRVTRLVLLSPIEPTDSLAHAYTPAERLARLDTTAARSLVKARAFGRDTLEPTAYCQEFWRVNAPIFVGDTAQAGRVLPTWCEFRHETPAWLGRHLGFVFTSLGTRRDFSPLARRVRAPTLILHGARDLVASPAGATAWRQLIPTARLTMLPNVGHLPFVEASAAVREALERILSDRP